MPTYQYPAVYVAEVEGQVRPIEGVSTSTAALLGPDRLAQHPRVIDGCSDLLVNVLGEAGRHARSAIGVGSLPGGMTVEVEAIVQVAP